MPYLGSQKLKVSSKPGEGSSRKSTFESGAGRKSVKPARNFSFTDKKGKDSTASRGTPLPKGKF